MNLEQLKPEKKGDKASVSTDVNIFTILLKKENPTGVTEIT